MLKHIITFATIFLSLFGYSQNYDKKLLKEISKYQIQNGIILKKKNEYFKIREKLLSTNEPKVFDGFDTLYIIETYDIQTYVFYTSIWSKKNELNYSYHFGSFIFNNEIICTKYTKVLIEKWDLSSIMYEETNNSTMTSPFHYICTRVIYNSNGYDIDCIKFKEFFLLERDN